MDNKLDTAEKKVLVDIVKLVQKRGMKGKLGGWKEFLNVHDKKFGAGKSDPSKRSHEDLAEFLKTFSSDEDLKYFDNILRHHSNQYTVERLKDRSHDSPEQSLVQATIQHPRYPMDYSFPSIDEGWLVITLKKKAKGIKSTTMLAVDCEMVLCEDGTEALVKVCVVDHNLEVKLHELVKPEKAITDYRTEITGVSSKDLETVTRSLADIQKSLKKLLYSGAILVGHSLNNDLGVLKLDYPRVVDTAYIFQPMDGSTYRSPSLNSLCQAVLGHGVRKKGATHNCQDDACATMKLVLAKIKHGVDKPFPLTLVQEPVPESEMSKLLIHRIPTTVNSETLHKIVPGDFTIELKPTRNGQVDKYSALAIFKNPREAREAYENVQGSQEKDSNGRLQKLVKCPGTNAGVYVRTMGVDDNRKKRDLQEDETLDTSKNKKIKMDPEVEKDDALKPLQVKHELEKKAHLKQIEALKQRLKESESEHLKEIDALNKRLKESELEIESMKEQLVSQRSKESELEIESMKEQLRKKDFEINTLHKMIDNIRKKPKPPRQSIKEQMDDTC
ncbi:small RNA degrading nuclease 1-like [Vicia villosa]|uniref:small RNA degrading nuclease 1-like n=1 Tax=Vicia villosa TaxID=3911 RepID=UPI00273BE4B1|nr:small RNA degrading nuclease 1-like [Vicia villosa]